MFTICFRAGGVEMPSQNSEWLAKQAIQTPQANLHVIISLLKFSEKKNKIKIESRVVSVEAEME